MLQVSCRNDKQLYLLHRFYVNKPNVSDELNRVVFFHMQFKHITIFRCLQFFEGQHSIICRNVTCVNGLDANMWVVALFSVLSLMLVTETWSVYACIVHLKLLLTAVHLNENLPYFIAHEINKHNNGRLAYVPSKNDVFARIFQWLCPNTNLLRIVRCHT